MNLPSGLTAMVAGMTSSPPPPFQRFTNRLWHQRAAAVAYPPLLRLLRRVAAMLERDPFVDRIQPAR